MAYKTGMIRIKRRFLFSINWIAGDREPIGAKWYKWHLSCAWKISLVAWNVWICSKKLRMEEKMLMSSLTKRWLYATKNVPVPGIEPGPRRWERPILTTRPHRMTNASPSIQIHLVLREYLFIKRAIRHTNEKENVDWFVKNSYTSICTTLFSHGKV